MKVKHLTLKEFAATALSTPEGYAARSGNLPSENKWRGGSWDEAVKLFQTGLPTTEAFVAEVENLSERMSDDLFPVKDLRMDNEGLFFDVARVVEDDPECWTNQVIDQKPELDVIISLEFNCYIDSGEGSRAVKNRGSAIASLVCALSRQYNLRVRFCIGVCGSGTGGEPLFYLIDVPEPLDLDLLNYMVTIKMAFRRLGIGFLDTDHKNSLFCSTVHSTPLPNPDRGTLYFPPIESGEYLTQEWTEEKIREILRDYNLQPQT